MSDGSNNFLKRKRDLLEAQLVENLNENCEHKIYPSFAFWKLSDITAGNHRSYCSESSRSYILCGACMKGLENIEKFQKRQ